MARHNEVGKWGERVAREHLLSRGYAIGGVNTRVGHYEIDFIAMKGERIVFVEVKTRSGEDFDPLEAVDVDKRSRLARAADEYIRAMEIDLEPQFDIVTVVGSERDGYRVEHIADAFMPPLRGR